MWSWKQVRLVVREPPCFSFNYCLACLCKCFLFCCHIFPFFFSFLQFSGLCNKMLDSTNVAPHEGDVFCKNCHGKQFGPKGYGFGMGAGTLSMDSGRTIWSKGWSLKSVSLVWIEVKFLLTTFRAEVGFPSSINGMPIRVGYLPWIGLQGCAGEKPPFLHTLSRSTRPLFSISQFYKTSILTKNHKISQFAVQNA